MKIGYNGPTQGSSGGAAESGRASKSGRAAPVGEAVGADSVPPDVVLEALGEGRPAHEGAQ